MSSLDSYRAMSSIGRLDQIHQDLCRLVLEKHYQNNMATRHIPIEKWLDALGMTEYLPCFSQFKGVEALLYLSETDINDMGIRNAAHRAKLISSLHILREKYERSTLPGKKHIPTYHIQRNQNATAQLSWSPPSMVNNPDYQVVNNVSPERLQHDLIVELQGDPADLKSKAWYHGSVSRQRAERIVAKNGDFLVRDCISKPGDFVLTCCWKGGPLHFVINSTLVDQGPHNIPKVLYHFEDLHFNSVQDLIQYYMDECKPITDISGAVITTPIARSMPLTYYDSKYGALPASTNSQGSHYSAVQSLNLSRQISPHGTPGNSPRTSPHHTPQITPGASPCESPNSVRRTQTFERAGSQPRLAVNSIPVVHRQVAAVGEMVQSEDGIYKLATPDVSVTCASLKTQTPTQLVFLHQRSGSAPVLTPGFKVTKHFDLLAPPESLNHGSSDSDLHKAPPPKPSRIPSVKYKNKPQVVIRNVELYDDDSRDYSDYSQVKSEPSWLHEQPVSETQTSKGTNTSPADMCLDSNLPNISHSKNSFLAQDINQNVPAMDNNMIASILDGHDYSGIPNFPLDLNLNNNENWQDPNITKFLNVKIPIIETEANFNLQSYSSELLPNDNRLLEPSVLIKIRELLLATAPKDLAKYLTQEDLKILQVLNEEDLGVLVTSGLELITLPQGKRLRQEILERIFCMRAFVMVTILTCPKVDDRAAMLSQWIQVAMEARGTVGNLFSFENIMEGLMSSQIQRLQDTWSILRQVHTTSAYPFDTKLKSTFRMLQDGSSALPVQDICIPSINPLVQLLERTSEEECNLRWEVSDINNGLDIMLVHLDLARVITANCHIYRQTGHSVIHDLSKDVEKSEMFKTEFHLRFLWGSKGAGVERTERHNKFLRLLTAYSERMENANDDGTAV